VGQLSNWINLLLHIYCVKQQLVKGTLEYKYTIMKIKIESILNSSGLMKDQLANTTSHIEEEFSSVLDRNIYGRIQKKKTPSKKLKGISTAPRLFSNNILFTWYFTNVTTSTRLSISSLLTFKYSSLWIRNYFCEIVHYPFLQFKTIEYLREK